MSASSSFLASPTAVAALHPQRAAPALCARPGRVVGGGEDGGGGGRRGANRLGIGGREIWGGSTNAGEPRGRAVRGPRPSSTSSIVGAPPPHRAELAHAEPSSQIRPRSPASWPRARRRCGPALAGAADTPAPPSGARARRRRVRTRREQRRASPAGEQRRAAPAEALVEEGAGTRREDAPASGRLRGGLAVPVGTCRRRRGDEEGQRKEKNGWGRG
ncbi:hypothetical protein PVAP13_9KG066057 [Panicum virgatum]|uniref:Uncharacterized protein n=1 Tax=Panicum virgatum TaxID=38727 RepID=A0A8T0NFN3_PANVG|nr:hypothetical protein PVAP13_9KG066057 [Panicum virgatum]